MEFYEQLYMNKLGNTYETVEKWSEAHGAGP